LKTKIQIRFLIIFLFVSVIPMGNICAQMPGMNDEDKKKTEMVEKKDETPKNEMISFPVLYKRFLGEESPYRVVIITVLTLLILLALKHYPKIKFAVPAQFIKHEQIKE
jgi:hypothetical protein